jgi:hypothetical protein
VCEIVQAQLKRAPLRELDELARDPHEAHSVWKCLSERQKAEVLERMKDRFGEPFAQEFEAIATSGAARPVMEFLPRNSGRTSEQLRASRYRFAGMLRTGNTGVRVEVWVRPDGHTIQRDVSGAQERDEGGTLADPVPPGRETHPAEPVPLIDNPVFLQSLPPEQSAALIAYKRMQEANARLSAACGPDADRRRIAEAQRQFTQAQLDLKRQLGMLDIRSAMPEYYRLIDDQVWKNEHLRRSCCQWYPDVPELKCD